MNRISPGDDIFFTVTMAEILEKQGCFEDALMIYKILADTRPGDESIAARIERLKSAAAKGPQRAKAAQRNAP